MSLHNHIQKFSCVFLVIAAFAATAFWLSSDISSHCSLSFAQIRQSAPLPPTQHSASVPPNNSIGSNNPILASRWNELTIEERGNILVYERCNQSVVNIDTKSRRINFFIGEMDIPGGGSGIVLDKQGHILTNFHVIEDVDAVQVTLANGKSFDAKKIGVDPITDIAVLKIDAAPEDLFPVAFGDSSQLLVGQTIYAIGNPFGLESTLTCGIISSLNRSIAGRSKERPIRGAIQIDAAINPGNSGGPLLDSRGLMIGMNTAIASRVEQSSGVGFAIPSNTVQRIVPQIIRSGKVVRGDIGIRRAAQTPEGIVLLELVKKGAAERAGLRTATLVRIRDRRVPFSVVEELKFDTSTADTIIAINNQPIKKREDFIALIEENKPGDRIVLTVIRDGQTITIPVVLD